MKKLVLLFAVLALSISAQAMSIDWSGNYRFEYVEVDKTSLDSPGLRKSYILNHLSLSPKIIAADGVNIVAKFEILSNDQYPESQAGQPFGRGPKKAGATSSTKDDSAVAGQKNGVSAISVSQLYLTMNQEYGSLLVGRAPLEFGLGMTHSAGNGPFDHWYDVHDVVAYKFIVGNMSFTPMIGKVYDYSLAQGREAQDMIFNLLYDSPETESSIGIIHQTRTASMLANDAPTGMYGLGGTGVNGNWNTQHINLYIARGFEPVKIKLEAGFESGNTGITTGTEEVKLAGYGIALDLDFPPGEGGNWNWGLRAGMATGDDPSTTAYEGFHFDRNYDVAFLMFNHPLGKYDLLRSYAQRSPDYRCTTAPCKPYDTDEALDDEAISNTIYVSPRLTYTMNDRWQWTNRLTWAQLQTKPAATDVSKDLGFEWDIGFVFKPHERIQWVNELGLLFPGSAWKGTAADNFGNGFTYGLSSKASFSF